MFISSCENTKIPTNCWTAINRRTLETHHKKMPQVKDKGESAMGQLKGVITMRSNPIPARWVTHKLENNNTKIVLPLLWRFSVPGQASQPGDPAKRLGIPREWVWRPAGFDYRTSAGLGETDYSWRAQIKCYMHQDPGERNSDIRGDWTKPTC